MIRCEVCADEMRSADAKLAHVRGIVLAVCARCYARFAKGEEARTAAYKRIAKLEYLSYDGSSLGFGYPTHEGSESFTVPRDMTAWWIRVLDAAGRELVKIEFARTTGATDTVLITGTIDGPVPA